MIRGSLLVLSAFTFVATALPRLAAQPSIELVAEDLAFPTNMAFAPGRIFFTEKETGDVRIIPDGRVLPEPFVHVSVEASAERGLLGIALDPDFERDPWAYLYYSEAGGSANQIMRVRAEGNTAGEVDPLITLLPAVTGYHNGGDMAFGPDGKLYAVTGEAHDPERAQDPNDLGGKVLRLDPDGSVPDDNPLGPDNPVYALGIRNSFGLCFDPVTGALWETENGPASDDEVNRIVAGGNYGWPDQLGSGGTPRFVDPVLVFPEEIRADRLRRLGRRAATVLRELPRWAVRGRPSPDGRTAGTPGRIPGIDGPVIDVSRGPDGTIYLTTTDSLLRLVGTPRGSPVPVGSPTSPGFDSGAGTGVRLVIAAILIGGLILLRRRILRR